MSVLSREKKEVEALFSRLHESMPAGEKRRVCAELARNQASKHVSERERVRLESTLRDLEKQLRSGGKGAEPFGGGQIADIQRAHSDAERVSEQLASCEK